MERAQKDANLALKHLFAEVSTIKLERLASITDQTVRNSYLIYFNNYYDTFNLNLQLGNSSVIQQLYSNNAEQLT